MVCPEKGVSFRLTACYCGLVFRNFLQEFVAFFEIRNYRQFWNIGGRG
jgi:hypothetical protein